MLCKLHALDKSKVTFKANPREEEVPTSYGTKTVQAADATVVLPRDIWEGNGSPNIVDIIFIRD